MCPPTMPKTKTAMPSAPALPDKGPRELKIKKNKTGSTKPPLRIDLATKNAAGVGVKI